MTDPKEHAGGTPVTARDFYGDDASDVVAVSQFDFSAVEDGVTDELDQDIIALLRQERAAGFKDCLAELLDAPEPRLRAWAMAYAVGATVALGLSGPEIAARFGRRKQAFFQEVDRYCRKLGTRLGRLNQRDEDARQKMRTRNFRHGPPAG